MKKLVILSIFFISTISFGQFFEDYPEENSSPYFQNDLPTQEFFSEPEYEVDNTVDPVDPNPGGVDEVPVDHYQVYLYMLGIFLGCCFLSRRRKLAN